MIVPADTQGGNVMLGVALKSKFSDPNTVQLFLGDVANWTPMCSYLVCRLMAGLAVVWLLCDGLLCGKPTSSVLSFGFARINVGLSARMKRICLLSCYVLCIMCMLGFILFQL